MHAPRQSAVWVSPAFVKPTALNRGKSLDAKRGKASAKLWHGAAHAQVRQSNHICRSNTNRTLAVCLAAAPADVLAASGVLS